MLAGFTVPSPASYSTLHDPSSFSSNTSGDHGYSPNNCAAMTSFKTVSPNVSSRY
ncbi:hypothetical protein GYMLUDRAFT_51330 [Collybiopsis luxurians FD-317 M1]|uniref:Uncharacterized protein n=1 Tax=Collybiopsis luxurians FD-317 M1 TaxID=944289 RepID=A0A0D0AJ87_9AGAR|nr:hypothetical protein GYMLUDRAFT_51330 [Collybiopsis luxurians FD-317 M1]